LAWSMRTDAGARLSVAILIGMFAFTPTGSLVTSLYYWISMACLVGYLQVLKAEAQDRRNRRRLA